MGLTSKLRPPCRTPQAIAESIYQAVHRLGDSSWKKNAAAKASGEKRILKTLPDDPRITWAEWKAKPGVFE
jgi:hypothetical protein